MKIIQPFALSIIFGFIATSVFSADIKVEISNIKNESGNIRIALWKKGETFLKGAPNKGIAVVAKTGNQSTSIKNVKPGTYAISIFHDENNNKKMDRNMIGIPKEGFGFSSNPKIKFGPPKFDAAAFTVDKSGITKSITIHY